MLKYPKNIQGAILVKKAILIPDSFKGTLSSAEICSIMRNAILRHFPHCQVHSIPVADGGEGSVDAFLTALGGEKIYTQVSGPYLEPMGGFYGLIGDTAVIEMAACAGLPLVGENKNPSLTSTYGVGELIAHALAKGAKKIIMGLGGSATNDGGCGAAAALGVKFINASGESFIPVGGTLCDIAAIDMSGLSPELKKAEIITMCDIDNPMYGPRGAAYIFGPQKGADEAMVKSLDEGLRHLAELMKRDLGLDLAELPGSGAAGAMGAGMAAFFSSKLQMGIETVLDTVGFDSLAQGADCIFTGEGKLDSQSLRGKVVIGVARRAKKLGSPVIAVVGGAEAELDEAYAEGVSAVFTINRLPMELKDSTKDSGKNLEFTMENILRLLKCSCIR